MTGEPRVAPEGATWFHGWRVCLFILITILTLGALASGMGVPQRGMRLVYEGVAMPSNPADAETLCPNGAFELHAQAGLLLGCLEPTSRGFTDVITSAGRIEIWVEER